MICKCGETGVLNEVLNQQFYYCRACKIEIPLEIKGRNAEAFSEPTLDLIDWVQLSLDIS